MNKQNAEYKKTIKELESDINISQKRLNAELLYHQTSLPYLSNMSTSLKKSDDTTHHLEEQIEEYTKTIITLETQNQRIKQENDRFQVIAEKNNQKIDKLRQNNKELVAENSKYEKEIDALREEISAMNEEIKTNSLNDLESTPSNQSLTHTPTITIRDLSEMNEQEPTLHFKQLQSTILQYNSLRSLMGSGSFTRQSSSAQLQFVNQNDAVVEDLTPNFLTPLTAIEEQGDDGYNYMPFIVKCQQLEMEKDALEKELNALKATVKKEKEEEFEEKAIQHDDNEDEEDEDAGVDELIQDVTWAKLLDDSISDVLAEHDSNIIARCALLQYELQLRRNVTKKSYQRYQQL